MASRKLVLGALAFVVSACFTAPAPPAARPGAEHEEDDGSASAPSGEEIEAHTRARFPGVRRVGLVKLVRWPERAPGPCTADFAPSSRLDVDYRTPDADRSLRNAALGDLAPEGWTAAYRTPAGVGFEKVADFEAIDLTAREELVCRCFDGERAVESHPVVVRLRWESGRLPEVSVSVDGAGRPSGLRPAITAGRLVAWEFAARRKFPGDRGTCDGRVEVTLLVDPPIL